MRDWLDKQLDLFEPEIPSLWGAWLDEISKELDGDIRDFRFSRHANYGSTYTDGSEWIQNSNVYEFVGSNF